MITSSRDFNGARTLLTDDVAKRLTNPAALNPRLMSQIWPILLYHPAHSTPRVHKFGGKGAVAIPCYSFQTHGEAHGLNNGVM